MVTIKISDEDVTDALRKLCELVGGRVRTDFIPGKPATTVNVDLEGEDFEVTFHPSGLLIHEGKPVFAYIRDHTAIESPFVPERCNKIHFAACDTLLAMQEKGRYKARYRVTNSLSNKYKIDIATRGHKSTELTVKLHPCQNCLAMLAYQGFDATASKEERMAKVIAFDAKQVYKDLIKHFEKFEKETEELSPATIGAGYPSNWPAISQGFRRTKKFTCEECYVIGSKLTDTHHKDGDKSNVSPENLQCLCKLCHKAVHPNYHVREEIEAIILSQRSTWVRIKRKYFQW